MMEMSMSMYATSADYWKHYAELLAQTMNETAAALGVEPDNEKMLEAVDALRKDADLLAWVLTHPETAAECLEDAAAGDGTARDNLEYRRDTLALRGIGAA